MEYGWQLKEEGVMFVIVLAAVFLILHFTVGLEVGPNFGTSFLIAAVATAAEVIFTSSKEEKGE